MKPQEIEIFYSVGNGGDGSAYPIFLESEELARWDQDHMDEGWGEPCCGSLTIRVQHGSYLGCPDVVTELGYLVNHWKDEYKYDVWDLLDEFKEDFFPDGVPELTIKMDPDHKAYYLICNGEAVVGKSFAYNPDGENIATEEGRVALQEAITKGLA